MKQTGYDKQPDLPPSRRNRTDVVGRDAGSVGAAAFSRAGFTDPTLVLRWSDIVGAEVACIARPIRLTDGASGGVLTVLSESGAAIFLQHESRALCERINTYLGRKTVSKLRFVQGPVRGPRVSATHPQLPPQASPNDPARRFQGSERLQNALVSLARARHALWRDASD